MKDLQRLLEQQHFNSKEEIEAFMKNFTNNPIPEFPEASKSTKYKAQDLISDAYELPLSSGKKKAQQALALDPDCIEAYEYLAEVEPSIVKALKWYGKGIEIGRKLYGGDYLEKNKGHFWGLHETRPFMRCMHQYAMIQYGRGKPKTGLRILEELIELNPRDNQGIRDVLLLFLIEQNRDVKFKKYAGRYKEEVMAFSVYTHALFAFKTEGASPQANQKLKKAMDRNRFVPAKLLSPKPPEVVPEAYSPGDEREATYFALYAHRVWRTIPGALEWMKSQHKLNL